MSKTAKQIKRRVARYPSCFGEFDLEGLCAVARRHGMVIIAACKPDMHVYNEIGLWGTGEQMTATEKEWEAAGNRLKPRNFCSVFGVPLGLPRKDWVDTTLAEAKARAIPVRGGRLVTLAHGGGRVRVPKGYRSLTDTELPTETDIAWNAGAKVWEAIDVEGLRSCGPKTFKAQAYGIGRKE